MLGFRGSGGVLRGEVLRDVDGAYGEEGCSGCGRV